MVLFPDKTSIEAIIPGRMITSSPLSSYWETEQTKEDLAVIDAIKTKETRYKDRIDWITNNPLSWDTQYVKYMTDLIKLDNAFNRGVDTAFEKRYDAQGFVKVLLSCVNISARIKWIKFISDNNFFQPETLTRLKLMVYCMSDALKTDEGKELTELCIDTDIEDVSCLLDEKLREYIKNKMEIMEMTKNDNGIKRNI